MTQRHFEKDEFPRRCDHCPAPLVAGTRYRRVLAVLDADDSFVGGERSNVENSFEIVFCHRCFERLSKWLQNPLSEIPPEGEPPAELDEAELEEELEKELFILGDGEEGHRAQVTGHRSGEERGAARKPGSSGSASSASSDPTPYTLHPISSSPSLPPCWHVSNCHCPECAPCKHHPGVDCECLCRFGECGTATCLADAPDDPGLFASVSEAFRADEGECSDLQCPLHVLGTAGWCTGSPAGSDDICCPYTSGHERDCPKEPKAPGHGPCLDPDKMLGASDQFGGSDYYPGNEEENPT